MEYQETLNLLKELGWEEDGWWNGRQLFSLTVEGKVSIYGLFKHFGVGITAPGDECVYCNMTEAEIREFTEILAERLTIKAHPDIHTLMELSKSRNRMAGFMRRMRNKKEEDEEDDEE